MSSENSLAIAHCNTAMLSAFAPSGCNDGECGVASAQVASPAKAITPGMVAFVPDVRGAIVSIIEPEDLRFPNSESPGPAKYILFQVFRI